MEKKILIVEDEPVIASDIEMTLEALGYMVVGVTDNAEDALASITANKPDLVLLDINLEGDVDGVMLAQDIREQFGIPFVYLTSNADNLTINRVKRTQPAGFILKPFNEKDLKSNIEIALFSKAKSDNPRQQIADEFFVKSGSSLVKVQVDEVMFVKADDNYSRIFTKEKSFIVSSSLKNIAEKLPEKTFMRIHRSFIVNIRAIDKIKESNLFVGTHSLPVGRKYQEELFQRINKL